MAEENVFEDFAKTIQSAGVRMGANFDKLGKGLDELNQKVDKILEMLGISLEDKVTDYHVESARKEIEVGESGDQELPSIDGILRSVDAPNEPMVEPMKLEDASVGKCLSLKQIEARNKIFLPPAEIVGKLESTKHAEIEVVDCELFGEDANRDHADTNITGDSCFEGCECFRYSRNQMLKLRKVVSISDDILDIKQEFPLLFGENAHRGCPDSNVQSQTLFSEPQFARTPVSLNPGRGPAPALIKAELASSAARRSNLSDDYCVLKTVMGILNNPTLKRFDLLKSQLIITGITSADILKGVVTLIFDKAVLEPTFCPTYARLFFDLNKMPPFPFDESGRREIMLKYVLLNNCQKTFEGADNLQAEARQMTAPEQESDRKDKEKLIKLRTLGNIRLTGEIFKLRMVSKNIIHRIVKELLINNHKCCLAEENVEASCQLLINIGKLLDKSQDSRENIDVYFDCLKKLSTNPQLAPRLRVMVCDVLDLRANNWVPKPILVL
ncbi:PREDICTED: eukaryotic translation initiation factor-like isoform X2 [Nicotiana attenuata]|uniref:eukaryotic translation initiation factor-like isoform X2 n=1 Tax=Nicotiana attenuata TaxID=49451 RepID=UPI000904E6DD|nr:PREDICTED: eukaryotic translation initiation factor-like isoform X2 [Nicotiana attenuata]